MFLKVSWKWLLIDRNFAFIAVLFLHLNFLHFAPQFSACISVFFASEFRALCSLLCISFPCILQGFDPAINQVSKGAVTGMCRETVWAGKILGIILPFWSRWAAPPSPLPVRRLPVCRNRTAALPSFSSPWFLEHTFRNLKNDYRRGVIARSTFCHTWC